MVLGPARADDVRLVAMVVRLHRAALHTGGLNMMLGQSFYLGRTCRESNWQKLRALSAFRLFFPKQKESTPRTEPDPLPFNTSMYVRAEPG